MLVQGAKRFRLRAKTPPPGPTPLLGPLPDFAAEEDTEARRCAYLVTLPHPRQAASGDGQPLVAPETLQKDEAGKRRSDWPSPTLPRAVLARPRACSERRGGVRAGPSLRRPQVLQAVLNACRSPVYVDPASRKRTRRRFSRAASSLGQGRQAP